MNALELARGIVSDFPSSAGRPFREPDQELLLRREELAQKARELDDADANELAARTWRLWIAARDIDGGRRFLAEVLDERPPVRSRWRALALYGDGLLAFWAGDPDSARRRNEDAFALARQLGDDEAMLFAQLGLSRVVFDDGNAERAAELAAAARALAPDEATSQATLHMQAQAARLAGDYDAAAHFFEKSLALNRRIDDPGMVTVELHNLGLVEIRRGNADAAEGYFAQLPPADDEHGQALMRLNEAAVAFRRGDAEGARALLAGIDRELLFKDDRAELEWLEAQLECAGS